MSIQFNGAPCTVYMFVELMVVMTGFAGAVLLVNGRQRKNIEIVTTGKYFGGSNLEPEVVSLVQLGMEIMVALVLREEECIEEGSLVVCCVSVKVTAKRGCDGGT